MTDSMPPFSAYQPERMIPAKPRPEDPVFEARRIRISEWTTDDHHYPGGEYCGCEEGSCPDCGGFLHYVSGWGWNATRCEDCSVEYGYQRTR